MRHVWRLCGTKRFGHGSLLPTQKPSPFRKACVVTDERDENRVAPQAVPVHDAAPFRAALIWVAAAWAIGAVAVGFVCLWTSTEARLDPFAAGAISIGSGLVALTAMQSGAWLYRSLSPRRNLDGSPPSGAGATPLLAAVVAGMFLRLVGTVALFLSCRYHLAASVVVIGTMTVGWYLYLTSVEVTTLARELRRFDADPDPQDHLASRDHLAP